MTRSHWILAGVFVGLGLYVLMRPVEPAKVPVRPVEKQSEPEAAVSAPAPTTDVTPKAPVPKPPVAAPLPAPNPPSPRRPSPVAPPLPASQQPPASPQEPARVAVDSLALNLRQYQLRFGGNPVGTNAEIVRELTGGNAKGAIYLPTDLQRLNDRGELIDEWGTPYFFHQESAERMEIRSAGADRVMWTTDDVVAR